MKFRIWCSTHNCNVIAADTDANTVLKVPSSLDEHDFVIDESNLYCLTEGDDHEMTIRL